MLQKIINRRKQLGISQAKIAKKIGVTVGTISNFETGRNGLSSFALFKLFDILDIDLLINGKD